MPADHGRSSILILTTQENIFPQLDRLQSRLSLDAAAPQFILVQTRPDSVIDDCFANVRRHIAENDGDLVIGWTVWEWPGVLAEAEMHAVWRSPGGNLLDVSPKLNGETRILFIADPNLTDDNRRRDNVRISLSTNPIVDQYIAAEAAFRSAFEAEFGHLTDGTEVELTGHLAELEDRRAQLETQVMISQLPWSI